MKKTVLVTGSNGFIGKGFIKRYANKYNIIEADIIKGASEDCCEKSYVCDICDYVSIEKIFAENNIDYVLHTAAEKSLAVCENNREKVYKTNYEALKNIIYLAEKYYCKILYISSDQVFDGTKAYSSEGTTVSAINYYGKLKIMAEDLLKKSKSAAICRTALVFGDIPKEQEGYFKEVRGNKQLAVQGYIVQQTAYCLKNGIRINLPADEFVSPTHVNLLADQLNAVMEKNVSGILHCCGNDRISRYKMGKIIAEKYGLDSSLIDGRSGNSPLRPKDVSLDCSKTEKILGFEFPSFKNMLDKYM